MVVFGFEVSHESTTVMPLLAPSSPLLDLFVQSIVWFDNLLEVLILFLLSIRVLLMCSLFFYQLRRFLDFYLQVFVVLVLFRCMSPISQQFYIFRYVAKVLRGRYYPNGDVRNANCPSSGSTTWKTICKGRDVLKKGMSIG